MGGLILGAAILIAAQAGDRFKSSGDPLADTLDVMQEPHLGQLPAVNQAFRFLWLRSFHDPVVVRVQKQGDEGLLVVKTLDRPWGLGVAGVHLGKLAVNRQRSLTQREWDSLVELRRDGFWKQPSTEARELGVDGADWIMDGVSWGERHTVTRWSPESGSFRELCMAMLKLSGITVKPDEVY